nr:class II holin family protein [Escherichia coli]
MKSIDKLTTGVAYGTSAGSAGYWFLQLLDKVTPSQWAAIGVLGMRDALDARKSRLSGGRMTKETQSTTVSATASQADVTGVVQATEGENASAAQPDVNAQITAAVAAENSRIMGILNCEEAHGREEQACVLAETPGMTVETARRILAAAPQSAQARSDTALDRLMQGAPAPLAAGNPASDAVNDLLNTPV